MRLTNLSCNDVVRIFYNKRKSDYPILKGDMMVYYMWKNPKIPKWKIKPKNPYITLDYDPILHEWKINYIYGNLGAEFYIINDRTGKIILDKMS